MASSRETEMDLTRCSICFEIFKVPKQLPCLHSFCEICLQSYITEVFRKDSVNAKGVNCPICRAFISKPEDLDHQKWGKNFPTNHLMNSIIDYTKTKSESKLCSVCERENESKNASHWCLNCSDTLCTSCEHQHRRFKTTAVHRIVEIDKMKELESEGLLYGTEVFCEEHRSEPIRFYCADHKSVCCMSCMMLNHRKCDDVGSVEDATKAMKNSTAREALETDLINLKTKFELLVENREVNIQNFETKLGETTESVETSFNDIINHFETAKSEMIEKLRATEKELIPQLRDEKSELESKVAGIANDMDILETTSRLAPPACYLQNMKNLTEQRTKLESELNKQKLHLRNHDIEYTKDEHFATIKQIENLFGNISVTRTEFLLKQDIPNTGTECSEQESIGNTIVPERIKLQNKIQLDDHVTGVAFVDDCRIIIGQCNMRTLEIFHMNGSLLHSVELSHRSWSIRMKNHEEGAVVVQMKCLQFFKISGNEIIVTDELKLEATNDFIVENENYLYVGGQKKIWILDSTLSAVGEVAVEHRVGYMALRDVNSLCYTEYCGDTLYCINLKGIQLFTYSHENLLKATGVTVDSVGNIYICGYESQNIHQLNHEGQLQRIIFDNLPFGPYCISFSDVGDKAVIGCCNAVLLYDLC